MLVDTSGTYAAEADKAKLDHQLPARHAAAGRLAGGGAGAEPQLQREGHRRQGHLRYPAVAGQRAEARVSGEIDDSFRRAPAAAAYTDITGGLIQGAKFLNETGAGTKTIVIFSDMQEELDKVTMRDFPIDLKGIRVIAVNVVKLKTDNVDPRRYLGRLEAWQKRVRAPAPREWRVINDLERLNRSRARVSAAQRCCGRRKAALHDVGVEADSDKRASLHHSMSSSARSSSDCGIVRPSALAVLRLMTSSRTSSAARRADRPAWLP